MMLLRLLAVVAVAIGLADAARAQAVPQSRAEMALSFAPLVKETAPAVVNVYARRIERVSGVSPFGADPLFRRFFGDELFEGRPRERVQNSLGSGVIVDASGVVVTNNHVIQGATEIRIVLSDRREFDAEIVLTDERTDLAVLRIAPDADGLEALPMGDSDAIEVGDLVLAIGNPFGVGQTVTSGIVSALARTQVGVTSYQFFIQTDAAINPGNSGGALIDMNGHLIGINTAIYSRSGGSNGIGFAIPVNMVRAVVQSSVSGAGRVVRPWLGAALQDVNQDIAASLGMERPRGAIVAYVHPLSPLGAAGVRRGDVLLQLGDRNIESAQEFGFRLATLEVGGRAAIAYARQGRMATARMDLMAAPEQPPRQLTVIDGRNPFAGLEVANLSPAVAEELGLPGNVTGVAVVDIRDGPARRVGFRKADIIVDVNGDAVGQVGDLVAATRDGGRYWEFTINRGGKLLTRRLGG